MPHFYFVVKSIQQEPLLVEWLRFYLSDSGEILALDVIQCDEKNHLTIKSTDVNFELASPLVVYDPTLVTDPSNPSSHKNKKACLQRHVVQVVIDKQTQFQLKLLRFTSNMRNFFNTGEFFSNYELQKEWKKGFQKDQITKKTTNYKVPLKLTPSEYTQLDCIEEAKVIDSINAQYSLLQEQFSQDVQVDQNATSNTVTSPFLTSSEALNEISDIEKVIQFSHALATALSEEKQKNLLPFLANIMDGTTSSIGFSASILALLQKNVDPNLIVESSFPARFLAYNIANKSIITAAYQLLQDIGSKPVNEKMSLPFKNSILEFCLLANQYSISFLKPNTYGESMSSSKGFENIALSGAIIKGDPLKRISSDEKIPFSLTLEEKNFQQLLSFFKDKFLLFLLCFNEENELQQQESFLSYAINQLDANSVNALYDNMITQYLNENDKNQYLKRLCSYLSDDKVESLLNGEPHAFHWVMLDHKTISPPCSFTIKEALHRAIKAILNINNFEDILSGVFRLIENSTLMSECEEATVGTILSFLFEHPELYQRKKIRAGIIIVYDYSVTKKWIHAKEQKLISHLQALMIQFVLNPTRENYLAIDDEYQKSYKQYELLRNKQFQLNTEKTLCPTSKDELHAFIIATLREQQGDKFLLKPCVDAIFSDFDNSYLEKEVQIKARKNMLAFYFRCRNKPSVNYPWLTQLATIFELQELWSFLQINDNGNNTFFSYVINDDAFLPFFEKIVEKGMVLEPMLCLEFFEKLLERDKISHLSFPAITSIFSEIEKCIELLSINEFKPGEEKIMPMISKASETLLKKFPNQRESILFFGKSIEFKLKKKIRYEFVFLLLSFKSTSSAQRSLDHPTVFPSSQPMHFPSGRPIGGPTGELMPYTHGYADPRILIHNMNIFSVEPSEKIILQKLFELMPTIEDCGQVLSLLCKKNESDKVLRFFAFLQKEWGNEVLVYPKNLIELGRLLSYVNNGYIYTIINNTSADFWKVVNISLNFPDLLEPLTNLQKEVVCEQIEKLPCFDSLYADWNAIWIQRNMTITGETMRSIYSLQSGAARTQGILKFLRLFSISEIGDVYQSYAREMKKNNVALGEFEWLDVLGFLDINQKCTLLFALSPTIFPPSYDSLLSCVYLLFMDVKNHCDWNETNDSIKATITYFLNHERQIQVLFKKILPLLSVERQKALMDCISKEQWMEIFFVDHYFTAMQYLKKDLFEALWDKVRDHVMIIRTGDSWEDIVTNMPEEQKTYIIRSAMRYFQDELIDSNSPPLEKRYPQYSAMLSDPASFLYSEQLRIELVIIQMLEDYLKPRQFLPVRFFEQKVDQRLRLILEKQLKKIRLFCCKPTEIFTKPEKHEEILSAMIEMMLDIRQFGGNRNNNQLYRRGLYAIDRLAKVSTPLTSIPVIPHETGNNAVCSVLIRK